MMMKYVGWIVAAAVTTAWTASVLLTPAPTPPDLSSYENSVREANARADTAFAVLDSVTKKNTADSIRWEAQRDTARQRGYAAGIRAVELSERADTAATDLSVALEPEELELFHNFLAVDDSIHAAKDEVIITQASQIEVYAEERAALLATIATHREYETALTVSLAAERALSSQRFSAYEAEQALRKQAERKGFITKALAVGGAGKVCYDAANDGNVGLTVGACAVAFLAGIS